MADHADRVSNDADQLMQEVTGHRLPVSKIAGWLRGQPGGAEKIQHDFAGRPQHLEVAGWHIDYYYDSDAADALPSRLTMMRPGEVELRLRIEAWSDAP
jgi:outer membrane biogenesis lipoprotein LolB